MAVPNNEGKACDAVIRLLEDRAGQTRADVAHPEKDGTGPPVELRLRLGTQSYAIEHTRIEAFAGQIGAEVRFQQIVRPVIDALSGTLPKPGVYYLHFPTNARLRVKANDLPRLQSDFIEWVREHAERLHNKNPEQPTRERAPHGFQEQCQAQPPGFSYEVILRRVAHWSISSVHEGILLPSLVAPGDVEALRPHRLRQALADKCPKLQRCKEKGDRTVLVLEDGDMSLSNYALIGDALASLLEERSDLPDEIYLVETAANPWAVRLMKYEENYTPEAGWTEFEEATLTDIT